MKKLVVVAGMLFAGMAAFSQIVDTTAPAKKTSAVQFDKAGDHLMFQLSVDNWAGAPDSVSKRMTGISRGFNFYIMLNKPFKTNPHFSVAFGLGVSTSSIFFEKTEVDITAAGTTLPFRNLDSSDHFQKYKLATTYLEAPIEIRYVFNPKNDARSWKIALGVKVGLMLDAHTKGKTLVNKNESVIGSYTEKQSRSTFFNSNRLVGTLRVGYGHFSLFGAYSLSTLIRDGSGPQFRPYQIGLTLSGL